MMAASAREVRKYVGHAIEPASVLSAAQHCKFKEVSQSPTCVKLRASLNLWSFGEDIEVNLSVVDGDGLIDVRSTCRLPTQVADGGRNARNVRRFFAALDELDAVPKDHEPVPICGKCDYLLAGLGGDRCPECGTPTSDRSKPRRPVIVTAAKIVVVLAVIETALLMALGQLGVPVPPIVLPWGVPLPLALLIFNATPLIPILAVERLIHRRSVRKR